MSLSTWLSARFIVEHEPSPQETADLLGIVKTDLKDARISALSPDRRLACCYNAILTAARAALRAAGYRVPKGSNHHYYAIASLQFTIGLTKEDLRRIESIAKKRATADYVRIGEVSESMVDEAIALADDVCERVTNWLAAGYP
jgi:hypothetical protein